MRGECAKMSYSLTCGCYMNGGDRCKLHSGGSVRKNENT